VKKAALLLAAALAGPASAATGVDIDAILRRDGVADVKISPNGEYLAATLHLPDRTGLTIIRRSDGARTANVVPDPRYHVGEFHWVSDKRLLMRPRLGSNLAEDAVSNGEIIGMNVDNSLAGTVVDGVMIRDMSASRLGSRSKESAVADLVDDLVDDDQRVIVSIAPMDNRYTRAERIDSVTGRGEVVAKVDVPGATFTTDAKGVVRFAMGYDVTSYSKLFYRASAEAAWQLVNDEQKSGLVERAIGFSADNAIAYLQVEMASGPDAIVALDIATGSRTQVFQDARVDPWRILRGHGLAGAPVGVLLMDGKPRSVFFDEASEDAKLYRTLEAAFPGQGVIVTSTTKDGRLALVNTFAGNSPGDFYVFDRQTKRAEHITSLRGWLDPARMATVEPVQFNARDGQRLHGYVTRPAGSRGPLPMVVLPHSVPVGSSEQWGFDAREFGNRGSDARKFETRSLLTGAYNSWVFDDEVQMLAQAGYAVLQVNYRGSGNHGQALRSAAARKWSTVVPDDLADATRWAVSEGIADGKRVCIYGTGMGAYTAIMSVGREPGLYRCAATQRGTFDLALMRRTAGHADKTREAWLDRWMGSAAEVSAQSATAVAGKVRVPVFMTGYGEGSSTSYRQFQAMRGALESAGVDTTVYRVPWSTSADASVRSRREHYARLLDFLSLHLGGAKAAPAAKKS
jgi:dipeptidyl aminopeptidase/acylaminoacyl peptidase